MGTEIRCYKRTRRYKSGKRSMFWIVRIQNKSYFYSVSKLGDNARLLARQLATEFRMKKALIIKEVFADFMKETLIHRVNSEPHLSVAFIGQSSEFVTVDNHKFPVYKTLNEALRNLLVLKRRVVLVDYPSGEARRLYLRIFTPDVSKGMSG